MDGVRRESEGADWTIPHCPAVQERTLAPLLDGAYFCIKGFLVQCVIQWHGDFVASVVLRRPNVEVATPVRGDEAVLRSWYPPDTGHLSVVYRSLKNTWKIQTLSQY